MGNIEMRILAIYRHYWPDTTPYGSLLRAILGHLAAQGHEVSVFSAQPSYNGIQQSKQSHYEILDGVKVRRITLPPERKSWKFLRMLVHVMFWCRAIIHTLWFGRYGLILGSSYPPILSGVCLRILHRITGTPYIYHCQDLHPESTWLSGQLPNHWLYRQLLCTDAISSSRAEKTVVLSPDMCNVLMGRGVAQNKIAIINNFALPCFRTPVEFRRSATSYQLPEDNVLRILFAGNHGLFQGLDRLVDAAHLLAQETHIQFIFMGEGAQKLALQKQAAELVDKTVFFLPHQSPEVALTTIKAADLGIVSLLPGIYRVAFPSKTMTYLSAGCPVLGIVEQESDIARILIENKAGYVPDSNDPAAIAKTILEVRTQWQSENSEDRRRRIKEKCEALFGQAETLHLWTKLIDQVDSRRWRDTRFETPTERYAA